MFAETYVAEKLEKGFPCACGKGSLKPVPNGNGRSKPGKGRPYVRRWRKCTVCLRVFTTYEFVVEEGEVMVASRDGKGLTIQSAQAWAASIKRSMEKLFGKWVDT